MPKNKKKRQRNKKRKEKAKDFHLELEMAKMEKAEQIKSQVALFDERPDYDDKMRENFLFSFIHYKTKECEICKLDDKVAKRLIDKLKEINKTTKTKLSQTNLIRDKVEKLGPYKSPYNNLSPDIEIVEIQFSGTGRIFAHFIERYFCIVAIKREHVC